MSTPYPISLAAAGYRHLHHWHQHSGRSNSAAPPRTSQPPKSLLIGWDAADWNHIEPLLAEGKLPALQSLLERGAHGRLASMRPMLSPMLWTTIATGKRPFAHGVHGFTECNQNGSVQPISGRSRCAASFWEILNHQKKRTQVVGWWPSHPVEPLHGEMVSNLYHHGEAPAEGYAWPEALRTPLDACRIRPEWIPYTWVKLFIRNPGDPSSDPKTRSVMHIISRALSLQMSATYLLHNHSTDLHAVYFDALDHFCHLGIREHADEPLIIEAAYRLHDMMLEGLLHYTDANTDILLLSDHGFQTNSSKQTTLPTDDPLAPEHDHRFYGVIVTAGPSYRTRKPIFGAGIADITPTLLATFGIASAKDMHGRVLHDILSKQADQTPVDSYDHLRKQTVSSSIQDPYLHHLADLGYIDPNASARETQSGNNINLARSYLDANRPENAAELLQAEVDTKSPIRTRMLLIQALLQCGKHDQINQHINHLPEKWIPIVRAMQAATQGKRQAVRAALKELPTGLSYPSGWLTVLGNLYLSLGEQHEAANYFRAAKTAEPDLLDARFGLARTFADQGQVELALEEALDAVEMQHFAPNIHAFIGKMLLRINQPKQAYFALKISAQQQPKNAELRAFIRAHFKDNNTEEKPVIVVSGLPRSGTSLMMQLLSALGIEAYTDTERKPDEHNHGGYFEYDPVKRLHINNRFLDDLAGKAIKITSPQLPNLSPGATYKVIMMQRPIEEVANSQLRMRNTNTVPFNLHQSLQVTTNKAMGFLENNTHWAPHIGVEFNQLIHNPKAVMKSICAFLGIEYSENWKGVVRIKDDDNPLINHKIS